MSDVNFSYLYAEEPYGQEADATLTRGANLVILTCGIAGAVAWHKPTGQIEIAAPTVKVADTIGAGDSFQAALASAAIAL